MKLPGGAIPGILCMLIAVGLWTGHDAASKWLATSYPVLVVLFWRNVFALVPAGLLVMKAGRLQRLPLRLRLLCWLRGVGGAFAYGTYVFALPLMPLADAIAVGLVAPILIIALSGWLLKERLHWSCWIAVLVGLGATLFIVRPGGDIPLLGAVLLLGGSTLYAFLMVLTRHIGPSVEGATLNWHTSCATLAIMTLGIPIVFVWPPLDDLPIFMLVGLITGVANFFMIQAFRLAPAPTVAPFEYSAILWAILFGVLIWGEVPSWSVIGGASVLITCGLFIMRREGREKVTA
ncbi:MAG: DMT family transporter [Alphaproteobacteria bacterium]|nr:DMT family transporter [Rhodospirillaceae bacterium]MBT6202561.1 DMT family transporter [Rhodospirillaceae bacterium]MBT6509687.1 DMT family transporter [Rhodospirillaceae bacterium]MBT7648048.1 DMT family transporter [Rhodospirillaceae bacterium]MDG2480713.1 DMT family transporter [Alphaproteobacteria bacterium]